MTETTTRGAFRASPAEDRAALAALGLLVLAGLGLAVGSWVAPDAVYYPFVWKYYYGPIVADAAGQAVTEGGVTARAGYNVVNTLTWAAVLGAALWNVVRYLDRRKIELTPRLVVALLPVIAAGGTLRGLIDADWVPEPWAYLFITPNIYVVLFLYTFAALLLGVEVERRLATRRVRHWHVVAGAGTLALLATLAGVAWYVAHPPEGFVRWRAPAEIFGASLLVTGGLIGAASVARLQFVRDPLYVLVLFGQVVDGVQNYLGLSLGYTSKAMGTNFLAAWFGDAGLLVGKVLLIVPMLAYLKAKVEPDPSTTRNSLMLVLIAILALGLAMGFHGGVNLLLGV